MSSALAHFAPSVGLPALVSLRDEYRDCQKCPSLCANRNQIVFGSGSASASLMVIGQAPGSIGDGMGESFRGPAGELLMDLILNVWPDREVVESIREIENEAEYFDAARDLLDEYIYWTNIVMCFPEDNRSPSRNEVKACRERLQRAIYAVDPKLIIATGKTAASALVGKMVPITHKRGRIFDISVPSPPTGVAVRYPMMALLDPSYALRKGDAAQIKKKRGVTYAIMEDLRYALSLVEELGHKVHGESLLLSDDG